MNVIDNIAAAVTKPAKPVNYTPEQTLELVDYYVKNGSSEQAVQDMAEKFGRSIKSIQAKLSREKVYVKKTYVTKAGIPAVPKDETADVIGKILKLSEAETSSLAKANKTVLVKLFEVLASSTPITPKNEVTGEVAQLVADFEFKIAFSDADKLALSQISEGGLSALLENMA